MISIISANYNYIFQFYTIKTYKKNKHIYSSTNNLKEQLKDKSSLHRQFYYLIVNLNQYKKIGIEGKWGRQ